MLHDFPYNFFPVLKSASNIAAGKNLHHNIFHLCINYLYYQLHSRLRFTFEFAGAQYLKQHFYCFTHITQCQPLNKHYKYKHFTREMMGASRPCFSFHSQLNVRRLDRLWGSGWTLSAGMPVKRAPLRKVFAAQGLLPSLCRVGSSPSSAASSPWQPKLAQSLSTNLSHIFFWHITTIHSRTLHTSSSGHKRWSGLV